MILNLLPRVPFISVKRGISLKILGMKVSLVGIQIEEKK